jgi:hypothetical protein
LGVQNPTFLTDQRWQVEIAYQQLDTNDFFVGDERNDAAGPLGRPPKREVNLYNLNFSYGVSDRFTLQLNVPYSASTSAVQQGTPQSHRFYSWDTDGFGDLSVEAEYWLVDPKKPSRLIGSVAVGVKSPTGSTSETGTVFSPAGDVEGPVDEAAQLGDGGWGMLLRGQGSAQLGGPWFGYASGYYLVSLNTHYDVRQGGNYRGVPDVYSARLGAAYQLPAYQPLVLTLGGMINGVPVHDLIGGGDLYWRRPGYEIYLEPGLTWTYNNTHTFTFSYPLRVDQSKKDSLLDQSLNRVIGADFAAHLIKASYSRRF